MTKNEKILIIRMRLIMVQEVEKVKEKSSRFKSITELCKFYNVSRKTLYKWYNRWIEQGRCAESLVNKSCRPNKTRRIPKPLEKKIIRLRDRLHWSSQRIYIELKRRGIVNPKTNRPISERCIRLVFVRYRRGYRYEKEKKSKVIIRYEKPLPGELGHIDTKKLKNIKGMDTNKKRYQFALIDDCTRIPYVEILPDKKAKTASLFLKRAVDRKSVV